MFRIEISSHTDIGDVKQTNQDCIFSRADIINKHSVGLFIVADGCGGLAYGEEISKLVVTHFSRLWSNELKSMLAGKKIKHREIDALLEKTIEEINLSALYFSRQVNSRVGSTLSLLLTIDNKYYIKNIGDSRVYKIRGKKMQQLTEDQSLVAELIRSGELTREEAKNFKRRNVLTMCIGVFDELHTYSARGKIKKGDMFLLCCDGLHNHVEEEDAVKIIRSKSAFEDKAEELRRHIPEGQANDNVSSVLCRFSAKSGLDLMIVAVILCTVLACGLIFRDQIAGFIKPYLSAESDGLCTDCGEPIHEGACSAEAPK